MPTSLIITFVYSVIHQVKLDYSQIFKYAQIIDHGWKSCFQRPS